MDKLKSSKLFSYIIIVLIYLISLIGGYYCSIFIGNNIILRFLFADIVATVICYIFSVIFSNTSVYDPYWSFTPFVIALYFFIFFKAYESIPNIILFTIFSIWSFRLTINWITTFPNLNHEDWRYADYRHKLSPIKFQLVNFFGLHMIPTLVVYAALIPLLILFKEGNSSYFSFFGSAIILIGILLEFFADKQMHYFLKTSKEKVTCKIGLWNYSRHPNYLGENLVWIGLYVALVIALPDYWYYFFGFILMIMLFEFISIPLAEKHHKSRRSDYPNYIASTSRMIILPHKK